MKKIFKKISGLILVLVAITIWCIYSYEQNPTSTFASTEALSRYKNRLGGKKGRKS